MSDVGRLTVLFAAAAGARRGYGHLVRCGVLADTLDADRHLVLRGSRTTAAAARQLGWTVHGAVTAALRRLQPDLLVVDDPSAAFARRAVRAARRVGVAVASVHDLGLGRAASDLAIDGSLLAPRRAALAREVLTGPPHAILHPSVALVRAERRARAADLVLIALGGGAHVASHGVKIAAHLVAALPGVRVELAAGFDARRLALPLPPRCRWRFAPTGLSDALSRATVAVVGGGVTLYEAVALGTPVVAFTVAPAQRPTVRAFAARGLAIGVIASGSAGQAAAAAAAGRLLQDPASARARALRGQQLIDGRGAIRVAAALRALAARGGRRDAA